MQRKAGHHPMTPHEIFRAYDVAPPEIQQKVCDVLSSPAKRPRLGMIFIASCSLFIAGLLASLAQWGIFYSLFFAVAGVQVLLQEIRRNTD